MPGKCDICEKAIQFGHNVSHSKRRTNRQWKANTHKQTVVLKGKTVQANVCTRCLRTMHKPVA
jgi:large subunit ribosomal protein L28